MALGEIVEEGSRRVLAFPALIPRNGHFKTPQYSSGEFHWGIFVALKFVAPKAKPLELPEFKGFAGLLA
jgi:hypothetical protein